MKVLLIDDDKDALSPLYEEIREAPQVDLDLKQVGFEEAESTIASFAPDIVVLDLFSGPRSDDEDTGRKRLDQIWKAHFRPVVIYSADPKHSDLSNAA